MSFSVYVARGVVKIKDLEIGSLFIYDNIIALKTGAFDEEGTPFCAVVGEKRSFTGGTNNAEELNNLYVTRISLHKK